ncbi:SDR family oxidoreductase [Terrisporobacter sp.]
MILVTGANGQTGRAIIKALLSKGEKIRAFVHRSEQIEQIKSLGDIEVIAGDMMDEKTVDEAMIGVNAVYHICSALNPYEVEIGKILINSAKSANVEHFVYHSVLHSVLQDMPHHQKKLMVEQYLVNSQLPYTIIQPAVIMQNILEAWNLLSQKGIFSQKFFTKEDTRMCMVDLEDVAEAVAIILTTPGHISATYELCGPENLSLENMLLAMENNFGHEIKVVTPSDEEFAAQMKKFGVGDFKINGLLKMFNHYNEYGFVGNANVLSWILGRKPTDFSSFISRTIKERR